MKQIIQANHVLGAILKIFVFDLIIDLFKPYK